MTEISFHFSVADRTAYACRLLRKATRRGARIAVAGAAESLARLDRELWAFDPVEFIPHRRVQAGEPVTAQLDATPVWLVDDASAALHHDVLVNLGERAPIGFESFAKLIEIVTTAEDDRAAARLRWRHYADRGYRITRHEATE